ncbi:putative RNA recognition motif domain, nucleotide-binding alpha-beta plait domain superfamily [Helianthus anomalus]
MELRKRFGFVQFVDPADATEAKSQMDGQVFQGRKLTIVFAEENRKKPADMRSRERRLVYLNFYYLGLQTYRTNTKKALLVFIC